MGTERIYTGNSVSAESFRVNLTLPVLEWTDLWLNHFGVVALTAGLLFRLAFFSLVPGVVGLFSVPMLGFRLASGTSVLICGVGGLIAAGAGLDFGCEAGCWTSRVLVITNEPGSPTSGLSSIYS